MADSYYNSVVALLHCDGSNGSTTFTDNSPSPKTVTVSGTAAISTAQSKFGGASGLFSTDTGRVNIAIASPYITGLTAFTVEAWVYPTAIGGSRQKNIMSAGGEGVVITESVSNDLRAYVKMGVNYYVINSGVAPTLNTWQHIAFVLKDNQIKLYKNGVQIGAATTTTGTADLATATYPNIYVGAAGANWFPGYIDDFRVTKDIARYTASFLVPIAAYPNAVNVDPYYNNVSLLLHGNGTNGSTTFTDNSPSPKTVTKNGNAQISTAQSKFGGASMLFDGAGDYLNVPVNSDWNWESGDYTVECWIRPTNISSLRAIVGPYYFATPDTYGWMLYVNSNGALALVYRDSAGTAISVATAASTLAITTWQHIALTKSGTTYRLFVGGIKLAESVKTDILFVHASAKLIVGRWDNNITATRDFQGSIDDLRITKGVARYTADFSVPAIEAPDVYGAEGSDNTVNILSGRAIYKGNILLVEVEEDNNAILSAGILVFNTNVSSVIISSLRGGIGYTSAQGVESLEYLSDAMSGFAKDFTNSPSGSWLDGYRPYATAVGLEGTQATQAVAQNLPTTVTTWSVNAGHVSHTYLHDFYFRIHTSISNLVLGNVLSEQIFTVEIWNAWFTDSTLTDINTVNLADVVLDLPITLPYTFTPLQYKTGTITVPDTGTPIIDGYKELIFGTQTVTIYISGQRVILWPFAPQTAFTEKNEWLTDVLPSRHGEQRYSLREIPRKTLDFKYMFKDAKEYSRAKTIAKPNANLPLATPLWSDSIPISNLAIGQTIVYFNTANLELAVDSVVVFWTNYDSYEIQEIKEIYSNRIVLKQTIKIERARSWLLPVLIGYVPNGLNMDRGDNSKKSGSVSFDIVDNVNIPIWPNAVTYLSFPVITTKSIVTGGLSERFSRDVSVFDCDTGRYIQLDVEDYNRSKQTISMMAKSRPELYALRRQFDYLQGKFKTFWLPSFNSDLKALANLPAAASSLKVEYAGWAEFGVNHIQVVGAEGISYFEVTASTDNLDGTETIGISPQAPISLTNISRISTMTKVRLDADTVEFSHGSKRVTTVKAPVIEIL